MDTSVLIANQDRGSDLEGISWSPIPEVFSLQNGRIFCREGDEVFQLLNFDAPARRVNGGPADAIDQRGSLVGGINRYGFADHPIMAELLSCFCDTDEYEIALTAPDGSKIGWHSQTGSLSNRTYNAPRHLCFENGHGVLIQPKSFESVRITASMCRLLESWYREANAIGDPSVNHFRLCNLAYAIITGEVADLQVGYASEDEDGCPVIVWFEVPEELRSN